MAQPNCRSLVHMMLCDDSGGIKVFRAIRARSSTDTSDRPRTRVSWTSLTHDKNQTKRKNARPPSNADLASLPKVISLSGILAGLKRLAWIYREKAADAHRDVAESSKPARIRR